MTWTTFTCTLRHLLGWWGFDPWSPNPKPKSVLPGWVAWGLTEGDQVGSPGRDARGCKDDDEEFSAMEICYWWAKGWGGAGWTYREYFGTGVRSIQCCWGVKHVPSAVWSTGWSTGWSTIRHICLQLSREAIVSKLNVPQRIPSQKLVRQLLSLPVIVPTYPDSDFFTIG